MAADPDRPALVMVINEQGRLRASARAVRALEHLCTMSRALGLHVTQLAAHYGPHRPA